MKPTMVDQEHADQLTIGCAQIAPVWFDRDATTAKVIERIEQAGTERVDLIAFGEAQVPGYPFWIEWTHGARFNATDQKLWHAEYMHQAVQIESGHLNGVCQAARAHQVALYLGIIERPMDRGGHSLYASMVYIDQQGQIQSVHRKLMPTYEERLTWSPGDGHGLVVHPLGAFTVGGLNCWENWMPLPRAALYGQGEDLHVAIWPGSIRNTEDITRFIARESRSYVLSVGSLMRPSDIPADNTRKQALIEAIDVDYLCDGGSCIAGPDGQWVLAPQCHQEGLYIASIDHARVREERQNFDPVGHYSRPDVTQLHVNRQRQSTLKFTEKDDSAS